MYSGVQASNLAIFAGAVAIILSRLGVTISVEELQVVFGAALVVLGAVSSWLIEWKRGTTNFIGTVKSPL